MKCKYCDSIRKNANSLRQHEIRCKQNPDRIIVRSNFIEYNAKVQSGEIRRVFNNQYTKAKALGLPKPELSDETRKKLSDANRRRRYTEEFKQRHSRIMQDVVRRNPDSYSAKNVSGRVKNIEYNGSILKGNWELLVAKWLDENGVKWTNDIEPFEYSWNGGIHLYFPDFYLPAYNFYIEVKGYERERDRCKWDAVDKLIVLKFKEINQIKNKELFWPISPLTHNQLKA